MKTIIKLIAAFAALTCVFSCSKEISISLNENEEKTPDLYEYTFVINGENDEATKTILTGTTVGWEVADKVGVYATTGTKNSYGSISTISPTVQFPIYLSAALTTGSKVFCYFPYTDGNNSNNANAITLSIPTYQTGDFDAMPQVSLPYTTTEDMAKGSHTMDDLAFCNLGSVIRFYVYSSNASYSSETVQSITFNASSNLAGTFTFDLTSVDYSNASTLALGAGSANSIRLDASPTVGTSTSDAGFANMIIAPGTYSGSIVLQTSAARYTYTIDAGDAITFSRNGIKKLALNLGSANVTRVATTMTVFNVGTEITTVFPSTKNGIKVKYDKAESSTDPAYNSPFRWYNKSTLTVTGGTTNILGIEISYPDQGYLGTISANTGTYENGAWNGTTNTVVLTNSGTQARFSSVKVYSAGAGDAGVEEGTPSISFSATKTSLEEEEFTAYTLTTNSPGAKSFTFSTPGIVSVDAENGKITALAEGSTRVTANIAAYSNEFVSVAATSAYVDITVTAKSGDVTVSWAASSGALGGKIGTLGGTYSNTIVTNKGGGEPSYTWNFTRTFISVADGKADNVSWSNPAIQLGSGNANESIVFTTSAIPGVIKTITVRTRGDKHQIFATVGSTSYIATTSMTNSLADYSNAVEGTSSGTITITIEPQDNDDRKAFYIQSIEVVYTPSE